MAAKKKKTVKQQDAELKKKLAAGPGKVTEKEFRALKRHAKHLVAQLRPEIVEALVEMRTPEEEDTTPIAEALSELNPKAFTLDGFEGALIGLGERCAQPALAVYDRKKCIKILMDRDGMDEEEADEFFEFNVAGAWMGENTPIILDTMDY